ncbi:MAG: YybS family protein [Candidatus Cloacimonetes bacterium]|nr:YybS family protein [Candidatus Cloacimonadota bacterium]
MQGGITLSLALYAAAISLTSVISPHLGLFLAIIISGHMLIFDVKAIQRYSLVFIAIQVLLIITNQIGYIEAMNAVFGVLIVFVMYLRILRRHYSYPLAIVSSGLLELIFGFFRKLVFGDYYKTLITQATELQEVADVLQISEQQWESIRSTLERTGSLMWEYHIAFWVVAMLSALYTASLLMRRKTVFGWEHALTRIPHFVIYLLIAALLITLIPGLSSIGKNLIVVLGFVYLIQGLAIIDFFWGQFMRRSKWLTAVFILVLVINIFLLGLVALMGLFDTWFNFRKQKHLEDINENHSEE